MLCLVVVVFELYVCVVALHGSCNSVCVCCVFCFLFCLRCVCVVCECA